MHLLPLHPRFVQRTVVAVRSWPVASQQRSRRNAMVACTALAQRRAELAEVEDFLAGLEPAGAPDAVAEAAHG